MPTFPCCAHQRCYLAKTHVHSLQCPACRPRPLVRLNRRDYIEATDANPERAGNGCMIYAASRD